MVHLWSLARWLSDLVYRLTSCVLRPASVKHDGQKHYSRSKGTTDAAVLADAPEMDRGKYQDHHR
jgi:hypothetical protein